MGSGCFSPALAYGQIDIEILDVLYEEAKNFDHPNSHSNLKMAKTYSVIK